MKRLKIYLDVDGTEKVPTDFKPFTDDRPHPSVGRRYCLTVDIPDMTVSQEEKEK